MCEPGYAHRARHTYDDAAVRCRERYDVSTAFAERGIASIIWCRSRRPAVRSTFATSGLNQPQPINESFVKDERENAVHERICSSPNPDATMWELQREFEMNWIMVQ